ncbi:MAG: DUF4344 domain-containing metallopeptidase [Crocosphaera sp.]|nr:DUF4344 domain-containing metallopeptidase [Crocosphaera sp.]
MTKLLGTVLSVTLLSPQPLLLANPEAPSSGEIHPTYQKARQELPKDYFAVYAIADRIARANGLDKTDGRGPGWGEHAPNDKRLFNLVCLVYGSNPEKYAEVFIKKFVLVDSEGVATEQAIKRRAARCQRDFAKKMDSWNKLLLPHYATDNSDIPSNRTLHNSPGVSRRGSHW